MSRKQKLNQYEQEYIANNYHELTRAELALFLGKPQHLIQAYIEEISPTASKKVFRREEIPKGKRPDMDTGSEEVICPELRSKYLWEHLKKEFTTDELRYFEQEYKLLIEQFQGDVLPTEELQIIQAIKLSVFMHRANRDKLQIEMDLIDINNQIIEQEAIPVINRNDAKYMNLKNQRQSLMSASPALARTSKEYGEQHSKIMTTLKGTREQRVKQVADSKTNILGLLQVFQTEKFRKEQALSMEVNKFALEEELKRLSEEHTYMDGEVDRPILNWMTDVDEEEIDDAETED